MKKKAVALKYRKEKDRAPRVVAKGRGSLAEKITAIAQQYEIPIHRDSALAASLYSLNLGEYIPEEFYQVVAAILAWVYLVDKKVK